MLHGIKSHKERQKTDVAGKPQHSTEGSLGTSNEVSITGNHQLCLLSVVLRDVVGLPVKSIDNITFLIV